MTFNYSYCGEGDFAVALYESAAATHCTSGCKDLLSSALICASPDVILSIKVMSDRQRHSQ